MKKGHIEAAWKGSAQCERCGIRDLVLFADLTKADFDLIHLPIDEIEFEPGTALHSAGDKAAAVYTLRSGLVKLVQYLPDGSQRIVRLLRRGDIFGLEATVGQPYEHSAIVLQRALVCRIPTQVIERLSCETPRLHSQLMRRWHAALKQADDWLTELSTGKAPQRLARFLLQTMEPDGTAVLFTREDLGATLGITTEHASRTVGEFKRSGAIIEIAPKRFRCDREKLSCIAAADC